MTLTAAMHAVDMARFATVAPEHQMRHGGKDAETLTAPLWSVFGGVQETLLRCSACNSESLSDGEMFSCISLASPTAATTLEALVAEVPQSSNTVSNQVIRGEANIVESRDNLCKK